MLGVRPQLGNWFSSDHDRPENTHLIVLSDDLWRRRFHFGPVMVGKTVRLDGEAYEVVSVMPMGFNFPLKLGTSAQLPTDQMQQTIKEVNGPLLALLVATALILLLACANIASLLLARAEFRTYELAVRIALGGRAWRIALLPMLQGVLLCCCGCLFGLPCR
jgi:hypothetical protein